jgi:hypothetical protein
MGRQSLSKSLRAFVKEQVAKSRKSTNGADPLYADPTHQKISSFTRSAETRSGFVLQRALFEGLQQTAELSVLNPHNFPMTHEALRELDIHDVDFCRQGIHLPISKHVAHAAELDIVTVRHRDNTATVYELRRGSGRLGYRAMRSTLRKLVGAQMLLRDYVHRELGFWVDRTSAHLIVYFSRPKDIDPGFPAGMLLKRDDLDEHFGLQITAVVDEANSLHGKKVSREFDNLLRAAGVDPEEYNRRSGPGKKRGGAG